jgi:hypothetical protein
MNTYFDDIAAAAMILVFSIAAPLILLAILASVL